MVFNYYGIVQQNKKFNQIIYDSKIKLVSKDT